MDCNYVRRRLRCPSPFHCIVLCWHGTTDGNTLLDHSLSINCSPQLSQFIHSVIRAPNPLWPYSSSFLFVLKLTGKSNHHAGNKRYRQVVSEMKRTYQSTGAKTAKTDLSRAIVEHVVAYGGRFIKREDANGRYFLLTKAQARRKTSQALRETKELKWTM